MIVTVSMQSEKLFAGAKASAAPKMTKTPISGVGDEAIFEGTQGFSSLWVRKGAQSSFWFESMGFRSVKRNRS